MAPLDILHPTPTDPREGDAPVRNVSRRFMLRGMVAAGSLVDAVTLLSRHAFAASTP